jgi:hypothetical protein
MRTHVAVLRPHTGVGSKKKKWASASLSALKLPLVVCVVWGHLCGSRPPHTTAPERSTWRHIYTTELEIKRWRGQGHPYSSRPPYTTALDIYMYTCMHVCMWVCAHTHTHTHTNVCILYMCPDSNVYMSLGYCMCPHTTLYLSSYDNIFVRLLLYVCPHTTLYLPAYSSACVLALLYVSAYCSTLCPHNAPYASTYCNRACNSYNLWMCPCTSVCVRILLYIVSS